MPSNAAGPDPTAAAVAGNGRPRRSRRIVEHALDIFVELAHELARFDRRPEHGDDIKLPLGDADRHVALVESELQNLAAEQPRREVCAREAVHHERGERHGLVVVDRSGERDDTALAIDDRRSGQALVDRTGQPRGQRARQHLASIQPHRA